MSVSRIQLRLRFKGVGPTTNQFRMYYVISKNRADNRFCCFDPAVREPPPLTGQELSLGCRFARDKLLTATGRDNRLQYLCDDIATVDIPEFRLRIQD